MSDSCLHRCRARFNIDLHPSTSGDVLKGVREQLALLLVRYNEDLGGVLLSYNNMRVLNVEAMVRPYFPYFQVEVAADIVLFKPAVGSRLCGTVGTIGEDYIGLLVLGLFNAVLWRDALPPHWRCRSAESCWVSSKDRRRLEVGIVVNFAVTKVVHNGAVFGISASMLEPGTGISDIQITADPALPPVSIFAAAAAVVDSAPAGEDSAPRSSEPHEGGKNKRANDARWEALTAEEGARDQHDAADGLRPGKRRKGGEESLQQVSAASHALGVSPTAAEATPPAAYVTKKELRLIRQAAAAAAVAAATATAGDAGGEGGGNMDHRENTVEVETGAAEVDQPVQSAESVPKAKGKKRKHARDDITSSPAVDDSANQEAAGGSSLPAEECAADTSKRRKKHKGQVSDAAEHLIAAIPTVDAPIVANGFGDTAVKLSKKEKRKRQAEAEVAVIDSTTSVKKAKKAKTSVHIQAEVV